MLRQKLFWLDEDIDLQAIEIIKARYGCESDSQVIRLALRVLAQAERLDVVLPERPKQARRSPKDTKQSSEPL
jgi:hypothetical protein